MVMRDLCVWGGGSLYICLYILTLRKIICKRKVVYPPLLLDNFVKVKQCSLASGPL